MIPQEVGCESFCVLVASGWSFLSSFCMQHGPEMGDPIWEAVAPSSGRQHRFQNIVKRDTRISKALGREFDRALNEMDYACLLEGRPAANRISTSDLPADQQDASAVKGLMTEARGIVGKALVTPELEFFAICVEPSRPEQLTASLQAFAVAVLSTFRADVHKDVRRSHPVDAALSEHASSPPELRFEEFLKRAKSATSSDGVELYFREIGSDDLVRVASVGVRTNNPPRVLGGAVREHTGLSIVEQSVAKRRATEGEVMLESGGSALGLAMGIPGSSASFAENPIGAVCIVKRSSTAGARYEDLLRADDYAYLRNIALRLSVMSEGVRAPVASQFGSSYGNSESGLVDSQAASSDTGPSDRLSQDIIDSLPRIEDALAEATRLAACDTATFRALVSNDDFPSHAPFGLLRVAAFPQERMEDPHDYLEVRAENGRTASAVISGFPQYVSDTSVDGEYLEARSSRSELALPIFVENEIVGVVNLESTELDHFERPGGLPVAGAPRSIALKVAAEVANARLALSRSYMSELYQLLTLKHDVGNSVTRLHGLIKQLPPLVPNVAESLKEIADIETAVETQRAVSIRATGRTLVDMIEDALDDAKCTERVTVSDRRGTPTNDVYPSAVEIELSYVLRDLATNLVEHTNLDRSDRMVTIDSVRIAGRTCDAVRVTNFPRRPPEVSRCANAYLFPLDPNAGGVYEIREGGSRPRLGTYLAGARIRSIGGMAKMSKGEDGRVHTLLLVPRRLAEDHGEVRR